MKLTFLPGDLHRGARLVAESGEILAEFGVDPEFGAIKLYVDPDGKQKAEIVLDLVVGSPATIVDADEQSVRALPSGPPLPSEIDFDGFDFLEGDYFYDDEQEWEDDEDEE